MANLSTRSVFTALILVILQSAVHKAEATIHDAVRALDITAIQQYIADGGDINAKEDKTGHTLLQIAIQNIVPPSFELKNYPIDKETFMFVKKAINCGIALGTNKITKLAIDTNNATVTDGGKPLHYDSTEPNPTKGKTSQEAICDESGNCSTAFDEDITFQGNNVQEPCISPEEYEAFKAALKRDAPGIATSVADILIAGNDVLFELLFYENKPEPEFEIIKLLVKNQAEILPEMLDAANIRSSQRQFTEEINPVVKQAGIRLIGDGLYGLAAFIVFSIIRCQMPKHGAFRSIISTPQRLINWAIAVKGLIDARNLIVGTVAGLDSDDRFDRLELIFKKKELDKLNASVKQLRHAVKKASEELDNKKNQSWW